MAQEGSALICLPERWQAALACSNYVRRLLEQRDDITPLLLTRLDTALDTATLRAWLPVYENDNDAGLKSALRRLRQRVFAHVALRDLGGEAKLAEVIAEMSLFADFCVNEALTVLHEQLARQFGEPLDSHGKPQRLIVIGMGKLGGRELNVSSDIDLIFVYPETGETSGGRASGRKLDNFEFFNRLGRRLIAALDEIDDNGQVFRVDMRLRPNGDSGPLVLSLAALENYFITHGREWERYAWIKARPLNAGVNAQLEHLEGLQVTVRPFVFRKYLDFGSINAMRQLHAQIRLEVSKKGMDNHVKLGPGGIREVEFIVQVFQLIRGGREPWLQTRPTLQTLEALGSHGLMEKDHAQALHEAYCFLRRLEHRLQYVEDLQTHHLPESPEAQATIALSMGLADWPALLLALKRHRDAVSQSFEAVFADPESGEHPLAPLWHTHLDEAEAIERLSAAGYLDAQASWQRLQDLQRSARYHQLPTSSRERLDAVGPRLISAAAGTNAPDVALSRGLDLLECISRRAAYLALLQQYPPVLNKVVNIAAASSWAAQYLNQHPILLDELLDARLLEQTTDWFAFSNELEAQLALHTDDVEQQMVALREAHHARLFRLLTQDLAGVISIEHISDNLSALADAVLEATLRCCWEQLKKRRGGETLPSLPDFIIVGYGKLGGKELGYVSDLDLVYLCGDDEAQPEVIDQYTRLAQRLSTWLASTTAAGTLFETDLRLRPNGEAGRLVNKLGAFKHYQLNEAWVWEHQALSRARAVAGNPALMQAFEKIRREVLAQPRETQSLRLEVLQMRDKMRDNLASKLDAAERGEFDLKHDAGGLVDVEFAVQYLVLGFAHQHEQLLENAGNIALLQNAGTLGLISPDQAAAAASAYREYRRLQHLARLNPTTPVPQRESLSVHIEAVRNLWHTLFEIE